MRATLLQPGNEASLRDFLLCPSESAVFLLDMLDRRPIGRHSDSQWWGVHDEEQRLTGMAFVGLGDTSAGPGLWVCTGGKETGTAVGHALMDAPLPAMCIGPPQMVNALWSALSAPPPRLKTTSMTYTCSSVTQGPELEVRPGEEADLPWLRDASVAMMQEDLNLNPRHQNPDAHDARILAGIRSGRSWVGHLNGERVFRLEVGTLGRHGAQVGGTWVPPEHRSQGISTRGMRAVCRQLLQETPRVTLHVRQDNASAIRCYQRVGFLPEAPLCLLVR